MAKNVPDYVERAVGERGSITDELLLSLIEAIEAQTEVQTAMMDALEEIARRLDH